MSRYRKDPTRPETAIATLAQKARELRIELQRMVKRRRRSDLIEPPLARTSAADPRKR